MWNERKIEILLKKRLKAEFDDDTAENFISSYISARKCLVSDVLQQIPAAEPSLSDHGPDHIANVLDNALSLLPNKTQFSALDLYLLLVSILFHDVGNLYGRDEHNKKISDIYTWARGKNADVRREKNLVLMIAGAHTGNAPDGSKDTLRFVPEKDQFHGQIVRLQDIASILRLADELAEGPQRTSEYVRQKGLYDKDSEIFHHYASITHVTADRGTERIRLAYEIELTELTKMGDKNFSEPLKKLLEFIYQRAIKLDQERRYARYYCDELSAFKATEISISFHFDQEILYVSDLSPIRIDDKVVPGDLSNSFSTYDSNYELDSLIENVVNAVPTPDPET